MRGFEMRPRHGEKTGPRGRLGLQRSGDVHPVVGPVVAEYNGFPKRVGRYAEAGAISDS